MELVSDPIPQRGRRNKVVLLTLTTWQGFLGSSLVRQWGLHATTWIDTAAFVYYSKTSSAMSSLALRPGILLQNMRTWTGIRGYAPYARSYRRHDCELGLSSASWTCACPGRGSLRHAGGKIVWDVAGAISRERRHAGLPKAYENQTLDRCYYYVFGFRSNDFYKLLCATFKRALKWKNWLPSFFLSVCFLCRWGRVKFMSVIFIAMIWKQISQDWSRGTRYLPSSKSMYPKC